MRYENPIRPKTSTSYLFGYEKIGCFFLTARYSISIENDFEISVDPTVGFSKVHRKKSYEY